jgi:hypothetical protein
MFTRANVLFHLFAQRHGLTCLSALWRSAFHEALDGKNGKIQKVTCQGGSFSRSIFSIVIRQYPSFFSFC